MKIFEVGYKVADGIYSVNMISANTGACEQAAVEETAERHADRFGYSITYIKEISESRADENLRRGMPLNPIDEEAERRYDPSFSK